MKVTLSVRFDEPITMLEKQFKKRIQRPYNRTRANKKAKNKITLVSPAKKPGADMVVNNFTKETRASNSYDLLWFLNYTRGFANLPEHLNSPFELDFGATYSDAQDLLEKCDFDALKEGVYDIGYGMVDAIIIIQEEQ